MDDRSFSTEQVLGMLEDVRNENAEHVNLPLALVLMFWKGDVAKAIELAKLLADIEPKKRTDVGFVFARQENVVMDDALRAAQIYIGNKFPVIDIVTSAPEWKPYPGVCADAWASAAHQLADAYLDGRLPYGNAFFFEPDGGPLPPLRCWIDRLKRAHRETLDHGKQFTGARMREKDHLNGSFMMQLRAIVDYPSLSRCPASAMYDVFHGELMVPHSQPTNVIANHFGMSLTERDFHHFGRESAWITSIKDGTHHHWARRALEYAVERDHTKGDP